jgi:hypothetical protein
MVSPIAYLPTAHHAKVQLLFGFSLACRCRHIKCDETKSACCGCTKIKQACVYANVATRRSSEPTVAASILTTELEHDRYDMPTAPAPADSPTLGVAVPEILGLNTDHIQRTSPPPANVYATVSGWLSSDSAGKQPAHMDNADALGSPPPNFGICSPEAEMDSRIARRPPSNNSEQPQLYNITVEDFEHAGSIWLTGSSIENATARWLGLLINDS